MASNFVAPAGASGAGAGADTGAGAGSGAGSTTSTAGASGAGTTSTSTGSGASSDGSTESTWQPTGNLSRDIASLLSSDDGDAGEDAGEPTEDASSESNDSSLDRILDDDQSDEDTSSEERTDTSDADAKPKTEAKPDAEETPSEWDEEIGEPALVKDRKGKEYFQWPKARAERIYSGYKQSQQYQEIAPTVDAAKAHQQAFADQEMMIMDLQSGDPARVENFLQFMQMTSPKGVEVAASLLPKGLKTNNPEAYKAMRGGMITDLSEEFLGEARRLADGGNQQDSDRYLFAAQTMDFLLGRPLRDLSAVKITDPVDQRLEEIKARETKLAEQEQARDRADWDGWVKDTNQGIRDTVDEQIKSALAKPLGHLQKANSRIWDKAAKELRDMVQQGIAKDRNFSTLFKIAYEKARANRTDDVRTSLSQQYTVRTKQEILKHLPSVVEDYGKLFIKQAQDTRAKAKASADRREPGAQGAAVANGGVPIGNPAKGAKSVEGMIHSLLGL